MKKRQRKPEGKVAYFHFMNTMSLGVQKREKGGYRAAVSICAPIDSFNRRLGRQIVDGRLYLDDSVIQRRNFSWKDSVFHANDIEELVNKVIDIACEIGNNRFDFVLDSLEFEKNVSAQIHSVLPKILK